ncbi:MAG: hypothetical protein ACI8P0_005664, partial [Planctomycetaceae bacterium]
MLLPKERHRFRRRCGQSGLLRLDRGEKDVM